MWRLVLVIALALLGLNLGLSWGERPRKLAAVQDGGIGASCPVARAQAEAPAAAAGEPRRLRL